MCRTREAARREPPPENIPFHGYQRVALIAMDGTVDNRSRMSAECRAGKATLR